MPFIHIKSLPMQMELDAGALMREVSARFSADTGIDERHITVTWDYWRPGHYLFGGSSGKVFDPGTHQVVVELLVPDYNSGEAAAKMMGSIASTLRRALDLPEKSIFICVRHARSGMVMEGNEVVQW